MVPMLKVETPCRLHLGQLDLNGSLGRLYGGLGVALTGPKTEIVAEINTELSVEGQEKERVFDFAKRFLTQMGVNGGARLLVKETIPSHVGLGSGTQLALAVGAALFRLYQRNYTVAELARISGRGRQSGVGIGVFDQGGFVVDGGIPREFDQPGYQVYVPPVLFRYDFPTDWCFLVITPTSSGYSGQREQQAFQDLPPIPPEDVGSVCRLLVMQLLPALLEVNIDAFGQALTEIQWIIGKQFSAVQGGLYSHPAAEGIVRLLLNSGATGAGQSSWGPTLYGVVECKALGEEIKKELISYLHKKEVPADIRCLSPQNKGALVLLKKG
jgi:beta-ribofuranosylaminobenzene 5'-phosphate synthase